VSAPRAEGHRFIVDVRTRRLAQPFLLVRYGIPMVRQFSWRDRPRAVCVVLATALRSRMRSFRVTL